MSGKQVVSQNLVFLSEFAEVYSLFTDCFHLEGEAFMLHEAAQSQAQTPSSVQALAKSKIILWGIRGTALAEYCPLSL